MKTDALGRYITTPGHGNIIEASDIDPSTPAQSIEKPLPTITTRGAGGLVSPTFVDPSAQLRSIDEPIGDAPWWLSQNEPPVGWGTTA